MEICNNVDCNNEIDLENNEGIIVTKIKGITIITSYYCSKECKECSE